MSLTLYIKPTTPVHAELYQAAAAAYNRTPYDERNSGFDLYMDCADSQSTGHGWIVGQGCHAVAIAEDGKNRAFWLAPRSSIVKTQWRLANSLGLIDATYRGVIKAGLSSITSANEGGPGVADDKQRYVQLATPTLEPWFSVVIVDELPGVATARGAGGFGSTGSA
jgi:dUTPase